MLAVATSSWGSSFWDASRENFFGNLALGDSLPFGVAAVANLAARLLMVFSVV